MQLPETLADEVMTPEERLAHEAALITDAQSVDATTADEAKGDLYQIHFDPLAKHLSRKYGLNEEDAQDIAQDVTTKVILERLPTFENQGRGLAPLLQTSARNRLIDLKRRAQRISFVPLEQEGQTYAFNRPDTAPSTERTVVARSILECIRKGPLAALTDEDSELILKTSLGETYEALAEQTGLNIGTIRSRLNRTRNRLSELMVQYGIEVPPDATFKPGNNF